MRKLLVTIAFILWPVLVFGQAGTISPDPWLTVFDTAGHLVPGACIWTYVAGTSTLTTTWSDVNLANPNTNPVMADTSGRALIFLQPGNSYLYTIETACTPPAHGTLIRTQDNINAVPTGNIISYVSSVVGGEIFNVQNTLPGTGNYAQVRLGNDVFPNVGTFSAFASGYATTGSNVANGAKVNGLQAGGLSLASTHAAGHVRIYSGGDNQRIDVWPSGGVSIFGTGDPGPGAVYLVGNQTISGTLTVGGMTSMASVAMGATFVTDAVNAPSIASGFGTGATVSGVDLAFRVTLGTTPGAGGTVSFNVAYSNPPVCVSAFGTGNAAGVVTDITTTTTTAVVTFRGTVANGVTLNVLCRGY